MDQQTNSPSSNHSDAESGSSAIVLAEANRLYPRGRSLRRARTVSVNPSQPPRQLRRVEPEQENRILQLSRALQSRTIQWADGAEVAPLYTTDAITPAGPARRERTSRIPVPVLRRANSMPPNRNPPGYASPSSPEYVPDTPEVEELAADDETASWTHLPRRKRDRVKKLGKKLVSKISMILKPKRKDGDAAA